MAPPRQGPRLFLVRHGETEWSRLGRHTGRTDVPLTPEGEAQALALRSALAGRSFAAVLTSPLARARDTCRLVGLGDVAEVEPDLAEWDYGFAEGRTSAAIREAMPDWTVWTHAEGLGEPVDTVGRRADSVIARASTVDGDVALFGHGHQLRILTARWLGLEAAAGRLFSLGTATLSILGWERETRVIETWNVGRTEA